MVDERIPPKRAGGPHGLLMIGDIVKRIRTCQHRPGGEAKDRPRARVDRDFESVETAADVEYFAGGDEVARSEFELLPSGAQRHTFVRFSRSGEIHESLMDF